MFGFYSIYYNLFIKLLFLRHHLYAWERQHRNSTNQRPRSASFSNVHSVLESNNSDIGDNDHDHSLDYLRHPGGFRRHHIVHTAREQGIDQPEIQSTTFVDYLLLFGHFAGEELDEEDDDSYQDSDSQRRLGRRLTNERDPLIPKPIPKRRRSASTARRGQASITQAVLMVS